MIGRRATGRRSRLARVRRHWRVMLAVATVAVVLGTVTVWWERRTGPAEVSREGSVLVDAHPASALAFASMATYRVLYELRERGQSDATQTVVVRRPFDTRVVTHGTGGDRIREASFGR